MPMPPWTCWAVAATRAPASAAQNFAMRGLAGRLPALAEQPGGLPHRPADRLDVDERVGHALLHGLEAADRPAELLALGRVRGRDAQRTLGHAELDRAQPDERAGVQRLRSSRCRRRRAGPRRKRLRRRGIHRRAARRWWSSTGRISTPSAFASTRKTPTSPSSSVGGDEHRVRELRRGHQLLGFRRGASRRRRGARSSPARSDRSARARSIPR